MAQEGHSDENTQSNQSVPKKSTALQRVEGRSLLPVSRVLKIVKADKVIAFEYQNHCN